MMPERSILDSYTPEQKAEWRHNETLRGLRERNGQLEAKIKRLKAALQVTLNICEDGDTGASFERVVSAMKSAADALKV